jgi:hypothetical protein
MKIVLSSAASNCARFMVFEALGKEKVPSELFPNQQGKTEIILESGKKVEMKISLLLNI